MKKPELLKIRDKASSMSQYLFSAHNKISKIKGTFFYEIQINKFGQHKNQSLPKAKKKVLW